MKFYTAFIPHPHEWFIKWHVTHVYLGKLDVESLTETVQHLDNFFLNWQRLPSSQFFKFDAVREDFGVNKDVRAALVDQMASVELFKLFAPLKRTLEIAIRPTDYPEYKPHVTGDAFNVGDQVWATHYALLHGDNNIVASWKL